MIPRRGWVVVALATIAVWSVLANLPAASDPKIKKFSSAYELVLKPDGTTEFVRRSGVIARGYMPEQLTYTASDFPEVNRDNKRGRADRSPPYYGRVLPWNLSTVL